QRRSRAASSATTRHFFLQVPAVPPLDTHVSPAAHFFPMAASSLQGSPSCEGAPPIAPLPPPPSEPPDDDPDAPSGALAGGELSAPPPQAARPTTAPATTTSATSD